MYAEKPHILIVDDDDRIRDLLARYLTREGMLVVTAESAENAQEMLTALAFDLMVLDVMMTGQSGVELTRQLRAANETTPILLLTARGEVEERIEGLSAGADDYLVKPFEPRELLLRIQAILRRAPVPEAEVAQFRLGTWRMDLAQAEMMGEDGVKQKITPVELKLLRTLVREPERILTREELARACGVDPDERTIDVQITRLRRKLGDESKNPRYIETVRGQGYRLVAENFAPG